MSFEPSSWARSALKRYGSGDGGGVMGFALPAVLLVLFLLLGIGLTSLATTTDERIASRALRESAKAFYAAEAGVNATIADWDQFVYDTLLDQPGDSVNLGWQTLENGCSYRTVVHRVDGGESWRRMYYVSALGRSVGSSIQGQRSLGALLGAHASSKTRALLANGNLVIEGTPIVSGKCPGAHANGNITGNGTLTIDGELSASDSITLNPDEIVDSDGEAVTADSYADQIFIPPQDPLSYCGANDYLMRNGWFIPLESPKDSVQIPKASKTVRGWNYDAGKDLYVADNKLEAGTYCVDGNVRIGGSPGSASDPLDLTILASKSVQISGTPYLTSEHPDRIGIMAGGDLLMTGSSEVLTEVDGMVYAGSQCDVGGNTTIDGQLVCRNDPDPPGALNLVTGNRLRGTASVNFNCSGIILQYKIKPLSPGGWYQNIY